MGDFFEYHKRKDGFCDLTSFIRLCNTQRILKGQSLFSFNNWWRSKPVRELIKVLEEDGVTKYIEKSTRKGSSTWIHPVLFTELIRKLRPDIWFEVISSNTEILTQKTIEFLQKI